MEVNLSLWHLIAQASWVVKAVMLFLLSLSVISWAMIIQRSTALRLAKHKLERFEEQFWSGVDLAKLYERLKAKPRLLLGLASIFYAGFKEFAKLRQQKLSAETITDGCQRAMRVALGRETDKLENHLAFLATVGSVSPYIGLFGTVWGIMEAFLALGGVQQATLAMVAPGIAEALIATAMGLFAAIPAVVAYNRFSHKVARIINHYQNFQEEFTGLLQRKAHQPMTTD